jgi:transcriptional regulatory protein LevR
MNLDERLKILVSGNVITEDVDRTVRRVIERFSSKWQIELTEENGGRMVTHLAMALMRIKQNKDIRAMEADHFAEFTANEHFARSAAISDDLCRWTPLELPEAERQYLIINICLILDDCNEA